LGTDKEVEEKAKELIDKVSVVALSGGRPSSIAGASIYIASILCGCRIVQGKIARVSGVTDMTIRTRYIELCESLHMIRIVKGRRSIIREMQNGGGRILSGYQFVEEHSDFKFYGDMKMVTVSEYIEIGKSLRELHKALVHSGVVIVNRMNRGYTKNLKKLEFCISSIEEVLMEVRLELDDKMCNEYPNDYTTHIFYNQEDGGEKLNG